ncbi:MAG: hypothetical protein L6Q97_27500, partial [Thermoanaerobaculia bacterium]|nr:hypothetical protein [Thermoanaerobaculia bacterium]
QKRYPPPVQFLFVVMFFFLFIFNHLVGTDGVQYRANQSGARVEERKEKINFYEAGRQYAEVKRMWQAFDSLPPDYRTPQARQALDSVIRRTFGDATTRMSRALEMSDSTDRASLDSITINLGVRSMRIASLDIFQLEADSIIKKYRVESWIDKASVRQGIKAMKTPEALVRTYMGSMVWTILVLVAVLSLLLGLLYQHTALFLTLTVLICINHFLPFPLWLWIMLLLCLAASPFLAMKRYYGQNFWQTAWKWLLFSLVYLAGFLVLFTMGILVVFFFF